MTAICGMQRFFDGPEDMAKQILFAEENILPLIDAAESLVDPVNHAKVQTALFIIFTRRAIERHGLTEKRAHEIVSALFDV